MGQKINSNIFRLGIKKNEWKSKYFEKTKEEFSLYAYQSFEIKKFLQKFLTLNGLIFHDFKMQYSGNTIYLYVSYYTTAKSISLISNINMQQKFKLKKQKSPKKLNLKKKTRKQLVFLKKQKFNLQKAFSSIFKYNNTNIVRKKNLQKFKNKNAQSIIKKRSKNRIRVLKDYKNSLKVKNYKNIKHLKINNFSEQLLESLSMYVNKKFNIFVTFQNVNKGLSLNLTNFQANFLKKKLLGLRRESRNQFFKETVNMLVISAIRDNSAQLLAEFIARQLGNMKRHSFFLIFVKRFLITLISEKKFSNISGIKFAIKGRFNGVPRARKRIYEAGKVPIQTIDSNIDYHQATSYTPNGTFGIKVWICQK
jgi:ribosomal protein S3